MEMLPKRSELHRCDRKALAHLINVFLNNEAKALNNLGSEHNRHVIKQDKNIYPVKVRVFGFVGTIEHNRFDKLTQFLIRKPRKLIRGLKLILVVFLQV